MDKAGERGLSRFSKTAGWRAALAAIALGASAAELPALAQGAKASATTQRNATNEKKGAHIERANRRAETQKLIDGLRSAISGIDSEQIALARKYPSRGAINARLKELRPSGEKADASEFIGAVSFILILKTRFPHIQNLIETLHSGKDPALDEWIEDGLTKLQRFLVLPSEVREEQILLGLYSSFDSGKHGQT